MTRHLIVAMSAYENIPRENTPIQSILRMKSCDINAKDEYMKEWNS